MDFGDFRARVSHILNDSIPKGADIVKEGVDIASRIPLGLSAFSRSVGVGSEAEYKRICIREGKIMYHAHIGFSTWKETSDGLKRLDAHMRSMGYVQDRAGICLDRRMSLPAHARRHVPAETGPTLETAAEWLDVGQAAPIQPHMGDFMIGFPSSTENTVNALKAGVTTVGNLSQFFSHEAPGWKDTAYTTAETVKAIAIMGALRERGTLVHSYLDDGFGALFFDSATVAGWALLERHIVEGLLGAKLSHCMGGLISDVVKRSGWIFALDEMHEHDLVGSMFFGDTISFCENFDKNRALVAEYMTWDIMTQLECPTGHGLLPMPVTEAIRVPTLEEIIEIQVFARRLEEGARRMKSRFDFTEPRRFAECVCKGGKKVFSNAMTGLAEAGVNMKDPVELLYVLKKLGPAIFEEMFGVGERAAGSPRGRIPLVANDVFEESERRIVEERAFFTTGKSLGASSGRRILLASTDVHEHALYVLETLLRETVAVVENLGAEINPDELAEACLQSGPDAVLVSTHNGMALEYAKILLEEMAERDLNLPVIFGGVLNQKVDEMTMPVDVDEELEKIGISAIRTTGALAGRLAELWR